MVADAGMACVLLCNTALELENECTRPDILFIVVVDMYLLICKVIVMYGIF